MNTQTKLLSNEIVLPVVVDGYQWSCNEDRMWNLNELHKALNLPDSKKPSQWRSSLRSLLDRCANLHTVNGDGGGTWSTEQGAIAYAMWVSDEFYLKVVNAFIALRNGAVIHARNLAQDNKALKGLKPISAAWVKTLNGHGQSLTQCFEVLGIPNKGLAIRAIKTATLRNPFFKKTQGFDMSTGRQQTTQDTTGQEGGYWKKPIGDGRFNNDGLKVTAKGFEWLKANKAEIIKVAASLRKGN